MDLRLDTITDDLALEGDDLAFTEKQEAIVSFLRAKLKTFLGEWFLDRSIGIPYFEEIFKKQLNASTIDAVFKDAILTTPGILELLSFELDLDEAVRRLTLTFTARSLDTNINFSEALP